MNQVESDTTMYNVLSDKTIWLKSLSCCIIILKLKVLILNKSIQQETSLFYF